jgi:hypothetical protein
MKNKMNEQELIEILNHAINRIKKLEHRLAMVKEDSLELQKFIAESGLDELFQNSTNMCDEAWSHFANIDIACDLESNESLDWKSFSPKVN